MGPSTKPSAQLLAGREIRGPVAARMIIDGQAFINFFGTGYLALSSIPEIRAAAAEALQQGEAFGQQVPTALGVRDPIFDNLEKAAAIACGTQSSVYLPSGYLIGMVGLASLASQFDFVLMDSLAHYNLKDAVSSIGLRAYEFEHCEVDSLSTVLAKIIRADERPLLVSDGIFPTTGRLAPLSEYAKVLEPLGGRMLVDESHGFGVVGKNGRGAAELCGVSGMAVTGATLSKSYCAHGAVLGCTAETSRTLRTVPPLRGASAGSPIIAAACTASLNYVAAHPDVREQVAALASYLRVKLRELGIEIVDSPAPIVSFTYGPRTDMLALQKRLFDKGIYVYHSSYLGAGPEGVLRCAVFRDHSREDIDTLAAEIGGFAR